MRYNSLGPHSFGIIVTINKNQSVLVSHTRFVKDKKTLYKIGDCVMINKNQVYGIPDTMLPNTTLHEGTSVILNFGEVGIVLSVSTISADMEPFYTILLDRQRAVGVFGAFVTKVNNSSEIEALKTKGPQKKR